MLTSLHRLFLTYTLPGYNILFFSPTYERSLVLLHTFSHLLDKNGRCTLQYINYRIQGWGPSHFLSDPVEKAWIFRAWVLFVYQNSLYARMCLIFAWETQIQKRKEVKFDFFSIIERFFFSIWAYTTSLYILALRMNDMRSKRRAEIEEILFNCGRKPNFIFFFFFLT
jgi:hypothetical protein